jgi:hypothetical protein
MTSCDKITESESSLGIKRKGPINAEVMTMERRKRGTETLVASTEWNAMGLGAVERLLKTPGPSNKIQGKKPLK